MRFVCSSDGWGRRHVVASRVPYRLAVLLVMYLVAIRPAQSHWARFAHPNPTSVQFTLAKHLFVVDGNTVDAAQLSENITEELKRALGNGMDAQDIRHVMHAITSDVCRGKEPTAECLPRWVPTTAASTHRIEASEWRSCQVQRFYGLEHPNATSIPHFVDAIGSSAEMQFLHNAVEAC